MDLRMEGEKMSDRDDLGVDPVLMAALARDGVSVENLEWTLASIWADDGHRVESAHHAGSCTMDLKLHRDEEAAWFATAHFGNAISYHAQRGRRSITLRSRIPDTVLGELEGRTADAVADAPGFGSLLILGVRTSPGISTDIIVEPLRG
jgi:hypothetical protein